MSRYIAVVLVAVCVAVTGCGKSASEKLTEKLIEKGMEQDGGNADVKISDGKVTITSTDKDGKKADISISENNMTFQGQDGKSSYTVGSAAKVPEGFPSDVLVYAGAKIVSSMTVPEGFNLALESGDSAEKIVGKYKTEMTAKGWKEESSINMENQNVVIYKKGDMTASLAVNSEKTVRHINLTVMSEK